MDDAYDEGRLDYHLADHECPYLDNTEESHAWYRGWFAESGVGGISSPLDGGA